MKLRNSLVLALASAVLTATAATVTLPNTGAAGIAGATDTNWTTYRFSDSSNAGPGADVTGSTGLASFLTYANGSTFAPYAAAKDATPFSGWTVPANGAMWLSAAVNASGAAIDDVYNASGYAFLFNLGGSLNSLGADFSQQVSFSFDLNGDNAFSAHLFTDSAGTYAEFADLLGTTSSNFNTTAATPTYSGTVNAATRLLVLLSNDNQVAGNPGGILVRNFSASYAAIPEPSTYAAIAGLTILGFAVWTRRQRR